LRVPRCLNARRYEFCGRASLATSTRRILLKRGSEQGRMSRFGRLEGEQLAVTENFPNS
jgi:hypothetical protein